MSRRGLCCARRIGRAGRRRCGFGLARHGCGRAPPVPLRTKVVPRCARPRRAHRSRCCRSGFAWPRCAQCEDGHDDQHLHELGPAPVVSQLGQAPARCVERFNALCHAQAPCRCERLAQSPFAAAVQPWVGSRGCAGSHDRRIASRTARTPLRNRHRETADQRVGDALFFKQRSRRRIAPICPEALTPHQDTHCSVAVRGRRSLQPHGVGSVPRLQIFARVRHLHENAAFRRARCSVKSSGRVVRRIFARSGNAPAASTSLDRDDVSGASGMDCRAQRREQSCRCTAWPFCRVACTCHSQSRSDSGH